MVKYLKIIFFIFIALVMAGCMRIGVATTSCARAAQSANLHAEVSVARDTGSALRLRLKRQGIQVVELGEMVSIIIPSDRLFEGKSARFNRNAYYCLNTVNDFLKNYSKTFVEVAGYTDYSKRSDRGMAYVKIWRLNKCDDRLKLKPGAEEKLLTSKQSAKVSHYLWSKGIDARMLYSVGYGVELPVVNVSPPDFDARNRRIEIHFQYNRT